MENGTAFAIASVLVAGAGWALWLRAMRRVAVPRDRRGHAALMLVAVALGCAAFVAEPGLPGGMLAGLGMLAAFFFLMTIAISAQKGGPGLFRVGEPAPDFVAQGESDEAVRFSSRLGGGPILLKLFRGHW